MAALVRVCVRRILLVLPATQPSAFPSLPIPLSPSLLVVLMQLYEAVYALGHEVDAIPVHRGEMSQFAGGRVLSKLISAALASTLLSLTHRTLFADAQGGAVLSRAKVTLQINKICLACLPTPDGAF